MLVYNIIVLKVGKFVKFRNIFEILDLGHIKIKNCQIYVCSNYARKLKATGGYKFE